MGGARALEIADAVGLQGNHRKALAIAARLHDEGKKADRWQRAFTAPRDGIYAKTKGPLRHKLLDGYRHEFGSLPYIEEDKEFPALPGDIRDLVLHLVAAHHGFARPVIETRGCEDAPPSALAARARDVALRFARLQKQWGPWGLAWWEALLRAADARASRENDERANGKASAKCEKVD
jgi:CRISPR-associated endonuclease/helicase Cas3